MLDTEGGSRRVSVMAWRDEADPTRWHLKAEGDSMVTFCGIDLGKCCYRGEPILPILRGDQPPPHQLRCRECDAVVEEIEAIARAR